MADRRTRYGSADRIAQDIWQEEQDKYDFGNLAKSYPIRDVRPIQPYLQEEIDEYEVERKAEKLNNRLRESQLQRMNRQITLEDAELKRMIATDKDIAEAQAEIGSLNPQSETYLRDRVKFSQKFPLAASSREYQSTVLGFLDQQHEEWKRQQEATGQGGGEVGLREYQNAINEISKYVRMAQNEGLSPEEEEYLKEMQFIVDQYKGKKTSQMSSQLTPFPSPIPTPGFQQIQGTTGQKTPLDALFR
jgi:hypothetical protein